MTTADMLWPPLREPNLEAGEAAEDGWKCTLGDHYGRFDVWRFSGTAWGCALHAPPGYQLRTPAQPVSDADKLRQTPREIAEATVDSIRCRSTRMFNSPLSASAVGEMIAEEIESIVTAERAAAQPPALKVPSDQDLLDIWAGLPRSPTAQHRMRAIVEEIQKRGYIAAPASDPLAAVREATDEDLRALSKLFWNTPGMCPAVTAMLAEAARRLLLPGSAELNLLRTSADRWRILRDEAERQVSDLRAEVDSRGRVIKNGIDAIERLEQERDDLRDGNATMGCEIDHQRARAESAESERDKARGEVKELNGSLKAVNWARDQWTDRANKAEAEVARLKAENAKRAAAPRDDAQRGALEDVSYWILAGMAVADTLREKGLGVKVIDAALSSAEKGKSE